MRAKSGIIRTVELDLDVWDGGDQKWDATSIGTLV